MHVKLHNARLFMDSSRWTFVRRCQERCKPFLLSKHPSPPLLPLLQPAESSAPSCQAQDSAAKGVDEQLYPVEAFATEFEDCEFIEPFSEEMLSSQRRWPLRVSVPRTSMRSHSEQWQFGTAFKERSTDILARPDLQLRPDSALPASEDVTIPKEMFDELVRCKSEATLKESQVVAAREELQKAYIALATIRAASGNHSVGPEPQELGGHYATGSSLAAGSHKNAKGVGSSWSSTFGGALWGLVDPSAATAVQYGPAAAPAPSTSSEAARASGVGAAQVPPVTAADPTAASEMGADHIAEAPVLARSTSGGADGGQNRSTVSTEDEVDKLRRRCTQLESSLASQGLAHRRLESELAHYQALARNELRQVLCAKAANVSCEADT